MECVFLDAIRYRPLQSIRTGRLDIILIVVRDTRVKSHRAEVTCLVADCVRTGSPQIRHIRNDDISARKKGKNKNNNNNNHLSLYTYIYIYIYMNNRLYFLPNNRSFGGPGGVGRDLGSCAQAKVCARELAYAVSRGLPRSPVV